jgi:hypothetical protein
MYRVNVIDSNESGLLKYGYRGQFNVHYKYLIIDNIYKLARLANIYCKLNNNYIAFNATVADCIHKNNMIVINKLPIELLELIKNLIKLFTSINIPENLKRKKDDTFIYSSSFMFSLVSKKLLKENNSYKHNFTFTNIGHLVKYGEQNIKKMLGDIMLIVYNYTYNIEIVWPITHYDKEIDEYTSKAYQLVNLPIS